MNYKGIYPASNKPVFRVGDVIRDGVITYRVIQGRHCPGDMVIQFTLDGHNWVTPKISHTLILADFKWQVEENNYGRAGQIMRGKGGQKLLDRINYACRFGWKEAAEITAEERARKEQRVDSNGNERLL